MSIPFNRVLAFYYCVLQNFGNNGFTSLFLGHHFSHIFLPGGGSAAVRYANTCSRLEALCAHGVAGHCLLSGLLLVGHYLDRLHCLHVLEAPIVGSGAALASLADGAGAASGQLAPRHGDLLQLEVTPAVRGPRPASQVGAALLLVAEEKTAALGGHL